MLQLDEIRSQLPALKEQIAEVGGLFDNAAASVPTYQPKTVVKKKVNPLNVEAFPTLIAFWWEGEGKHKTVEELAKMFKPMITYCEKRANDKANPEFIRDEHIEYVDEIKAK